MKDEKILFVISVLSGVLFVGLANGVLSHMEYTVTERIFCITLLHGGIYGVLCYNSAFSKSMDVLEAYMFVFGLQSLTTPVYMIVWIVWGFQHTGFSLGLFYSLILQKLRPSLSKLLYKCYHWAHQVPRRVSRLFLRQDGGILLRLPPELRLNVYSHLLPSDQHLSVSRALRQTCRQINHEVEHEQRKDFERQIKALKLTEEYLYKDLALCCDSDTYHVDISLSVVGSRSTTEWKDYCTALTSGAHVLDSGGYVPPLYLYGILPSTTRSIKVTLGIPAETPSEVLSMVFQYYHDRLHTLSPRLSRPGSELENCNCTALRWSMNAQWLWFPYYTIGTSHGSHGGSSSRVVPVDTKWLFHDAGITRCR